MATYDNRLRALLDDPASFSATPGYQFQRDQALEAVNRSNSRQRGSFNALAALADRASGMAATEYNGQRDFLGRMSGQEQQYELGSEANRLTGVRDANAMTLGTGRLDLDRTLGTRAADTADRRVGYDYDIAKGGLDNTRRANDQNYGLGVYKAGNDYDVAKENNANSAQRDWYDYSVNSDRNNITRADNENRYNLDAARLPLDWYNARTTRGSARSQDYYRGDASDLEWLKTNPPRRYI